MRKYIVIIIFLSLLVCACSQTPELPLVDKKASRQTIALYNNLMKVQRQGKVLFGHQDATSYGRTWRGDEDRSDVKDVTGSHPAVVGLDFANVTNTDQTIFNREKKILVNSVINTHKRGGVSTFAWHATNPANGGSFYWEQNPVKIIPDILPGGRHHITYKKYLQAIANVVSEFRDDSGELIPVIFRPFHEYDGEWFWWGKGHCTKEEFLTLWQFTIDYLRYDLGVHNFIYAFSPDCRFDTEEEYLDYYPGDDYVDMLGMDDYWDFRPDGMNDPPLAEMKLKIVSDVAARKNKLAALTETGLEGIIQPDWFTATLLPILKKVNICYVLVWRNAHDMEHHYYVPDKGHQAAEDFKKFCDDETILMESDLGNMYEREEVFSGWKKQPE